MRLYRSWFVTIFISVLAFGCDDSEDLRLDMRGANTIVLDSLNTIGTRGVEGSRIELGRIGYIEIDQKSNIYVVDAGLFRINKYSPRGEFVRTFGSGHGLGNGQFLRPKRIAFDSKGNVYALDFERRNVTVFDSMGSVVDVFSVPMMPSHIVIDRDDHLYILGDPRSYRGPLIHKYKTNGTFLMSFCDRKGIHELALKSGNFGYITKDRFGNLYYSLPYPYEIRKFTPEGKLTARFSRPTPEFKEPFLIRQIHVDKVRMPSGTKDLLVLPTGDIIQLVYHRDFSTQNTYPIVQFDLFSAAGDWLINIPLHNLGIAKYRPMALDHQGNFYIGHRDPYPRVVKYSLSIVNTERE